MLNQTQTSVPDSGLYITSVDGARMFNNVTKITGGRYDIKLLVHKTAVLGKVSYHLYFVDDTIPKPERKQIQAYIIGVIDTLKRLPDYVL